MYSIVQISHSWHSHIRARQLFRHWPSTIRRTQRACECNFRASQYFSASHNTPSSYSASPSSRWPDHNDCHHYQFHRCRNCSGCIHPLDHPFKYSQCVQAQVRTVGFNEKKNYGCQRKSLRSILAILYCRISDRICHSYFCNTESSWR